MLLSLSAPKFSTFSVGSCIIEEEHELENNFANILAMMITEAIQSVFPSSS